MRVFSPLIKGFSLESVVLNVEIEVGVPRAQPHLSGAAHFKIGLLSRDKQPLKTWRPKIKKFE